MIDKRSCLVYACHAKRLYPLLVNWARMQADRTVGALPYSIYLCLLMFLLSLITSHSLCLDPARSGQLNAIP